MTNPLRKENIDEENLTTADFMLVMRTGPAESSELPLVRREETLNWEDWSDWASGRVWPPERPRVTLAVSRPPRC
jgi:hypothetical protein